MRRKFLCKNCGYVFDADEKFEVKCPKCGDDNVEPIKHYVPAYVRKVIIYLALILIAIVGIVFFSWRCKQRHNSMPVSEDDVIENPATVVVSQPVLADDGTYSVKVEGRNTPQGIKYRFVRMSHFDKKVLDENKDGHFHGIPYCDEDSHSYDFAIVDSKADTLLCVPVEQTGFIKQQNIAEEHKMTIEQLQNLINTQDESLNGIGNSDYLAPDYKLIFEGLTSDMKKPKSWSEVFEMLEFEIWESVTISKLSYDDKNRIKCATLRVTMPK